MQAELALIQKPVTPNVIAAQKTTTDALRLSIQVSGREQKAIYMDLEIDPSQWSKIMMGKAHFPQDKYHDFMRACGNRIFLEWLALKDGCGLVTLESELERENRKLKTQLQKERSEREAIANFLKETGR